MNEKVIIKSVFDITLDSKEDIIRSLVKKGVEIQAIQPTSQEDVYQSFIEREEQGTTGLVDGFAIPHAENEGVILPALIIYKLNDSVEWESIDGQLINFVFGILVPSKEKGTAHLKILSEVAKMLMKKNAKIELADANSEQDIMDIIKKYTSID